MPRGSKEQKRRKLTIYLFDVPEGQRNGHEELETSDDPQSCPDVARGFADASTGNGAQQGQDEGDDTTVALLIAQQEQLGIHHQIAQQTGDHHGRHFVVAQHTTGDGLARGLHTEQDDDGLLAPVGDVGGGVGVG